MKMEEIFSPNLEVENFADGTFSRLIVTVTQLNLTASFVCAVCSAAA